MATGIAATSELLRPGDADVDGTRVLRLHLNESPYGAPPAAVADAAEELSARHSHYPDHDCAELRDRIARAHAVLPEMIAATNGVDELIQLISLTLLGSSGKRGAVALTDRTFPGYAASAGVAGARVHTVPMPDRGVPAGAIIEAFAAGATLAFICNPHNPDGSALGPDDVDAIIAGAEKSSAVAVFDEAYVEFAGGDRDRAVEAVHAGRPVIVLRTFSKAWGLAALRVGYAIGPADLLEKVRRTRQATPFSVNRLAQRAAITALDHPEFIAHVRERTAAARDRLCRKLAALGVDYGPSETNFLMIRLGQGLDSGATARALATEHQVLVRDLAPLGWPGRLRVTVGTDAQVDRFCEALAAVLPGTGAGPILHRVHS